MRDYKKLRLIVPGVELVSFEGELYTTRKLLIGTLPISEVQTEAVRLKSINHPSLLKIHEVLLVSPSELLVIESYCPEGSLSNLIGSNAIMVTDFMEQLANGVHYLHSSKKSMHGDLISNRILIKDGRLLIQVPSRFSNDTEASFKEEPIPPQLREGMHGYESDIWSLGVLFIELLLNRRMLSYESTILQEELQQTQCSQPVRQLVKRMVQPQMHLRPTSTEILIGLNLYDPPPLTVDSLIESLLTKLHLSWYQKISRLKLKDKQGVTYDGVKSAAESGDTKAMFLLARMLCQSTGCEKNITEAKRWLQLAAEKGEALAYCNLFQLEDDNELAKPYLQRGLELGDERCIWFTAKALIHGFYGFQMDQKEGLEMLKRLPANFPDAKYETARALKGINNLAVEFPPEQSDLFIEGAKLGHKKAVEALGECQYEDDEYVSAMKSYLIAYRMDGDSIAEMCDLENGNGACMHALGDRLSSQKWFLLGLRNGNTQAKGNMSKILLF